MVLQTHAFSGLSASSVSLLAASAQSCWCAHPTGAVQAAGQSIRPTDVLCICNEPVFFFVRQLMLLAAKKEAPKFGMGKIPALKTDLPRRPCGLLPVVCDHSAASQTICFVGHMIQEPGWYV